MSPITEYQKSLLMHSLGASQKGAKLGFRNYFCAGRDTTDQRHCEKLVELGFMVRGVSKNEAGATYYFVTDEGKMLCGLKPEHTATPKPTECETTDSEGEG